MAKFDLRFIDNYDDDFSIKVEMRESELYTKNEKNIVISLFSGSPNPHNIRLDKSTAIKFSKALRTEINKIQEL
jgi:hypothetical protein